MARKVVGNDQDQQDEDDEWLMMIEGQQGRRITNHEISKKGKEGDAALSYPILSYNGHVHNCVISITEVMFQLLKTKQNKIKQYKRKKNICQELGGI